MRVATVLVVGLVLGCAAAVRAEEPAQDVRDRRTSSSRSAGAAPIVAPPGSVVEQYRLNAQYRGTVKKGFNDIGRGHAVFMPQAGGSFTVKLQGSVEDPENKDVYQFLLDMEFNSAGTQIREVKNRSRYSRNASDYRDRVEKVIPFIYLVKFLAPPRQGEEPSRIYRFRGQDFTLRYMHADRNIEATLYEGDTLVGKFFLTHGGITPLAIEKFRVPTEGNVVMSFVKI